MSTAADIRGDFSDAEIEAGRRLFAGEWNFLSAAGSLASLPPMAGPEIAFAGRSNVGKSSLINALTGRRALARTSNTPGRTQELIFFGGARIGSCWSICRATAMRPRPRPRSPPGRRLIHDYLRGRATLARVYLLVDARHGLKAADDAILDTLEQGRGQPRDRAHQMRSGQRGGTRRPAGGDDRAAMRKRPAAFPDLIATSARNRRRHRRSCAPPSRRLLAERG